MTRPQMIRADTMDLQSRDAPSAQDHSALHSPPPVRRDLNQQSSIKTVNSSEEIRRDILVQSNQSNGVYQTNDYDLQNGNESESEMLDTDEEDLMNAEEMSSTSPSIDNEDIDFEFVYALHTFQATVEGQANAVKGDTMVLLDDSNSYWWLVRIVKDSSIGYLPAEHIETPSERLARLNKHRNMDLASSHLGDNVDKPKNSLGGILSRKKKPRNVTFTSPFFSIVEYQVEDSEDDEYPTNDEDEEGGQEDSKEQDQKQQTQQTEPVTIYSEPDEITSVESEPQQRQYTGNNGGLAGQPAMGRIMIGNDTVKTISSAEQQKKSLESERRTVNLVVADGQADKGPALENGKPEFKLRTRGNTDSAFFGDETMKISLTPAVARYQDEESGSTNSSPVTTLSNNSSVKELGRGSLDKTQKRDDVMSPPPGSKTKEKLKKAGVLGGLFSRRRKGRKSDDDDLDSFLHSEKDKKSSESQREAEAQAERERQEQEKKQAEEQARKQREAQQQQQQREIEMRKEAEARREAELKRRELEQRQKAEAEQRRRDADQKRKEIEQRQRMEAEQKQRMEAEKKRQEAEAKARAEAEEQARIEAERKRREQEEEQLRLLEEQRQREIEEARRKQEEEEEEQRQMEEEQRRMEEERRRQEEEEAERKRIQEEEERRRRELEEEEERERERLRQEEELRRQEIEKEILLQKKIQEELAMKRDEEQKRQQQLRLDQQRAHEQRQQEQRKLQLGQQGSVTSNRPTRQNSLMQGFQSFNGFRSNTPGDQGQDDRSHTPTGQAANGYQNGYNGRSETPTNPALQGARSGTPTRSQTPTKLPAVLRVGMEAIHTKSRSSSKESNQGIMSPSGGPIPPKSTLRVDTYDKAGPQRGTPLDHSPISPLEDTKPAEANGHDENSGDFDNHGLYYRDSPMNRSRPSLNGAPSSVLSKNGPGSTRRPSREVGNAAQRRFPIKAHHGDRPERSSSMESRASRATPNSAQSSKASLHETIDRVTESPEEEEESHEDRSHDSSRTQSFETPRVRSKPERNISGSSSSEHRFNFEMPKPRPRNEHHYQKGKEVYQTSEFQKILDELRSSPGDVSRIPQWNDEQYQKYLDDESGELQEMLGRIYDVPEEVENSIDIANYSQEKNGASFNLAMKQLEELESRLDKVFQEFFMETTGLDPFQDPDGIISPEERKHRDKWIEEQKKKLGTNDITKIPSYKRVHERLPSEKPSNPVGPQSPPRGHTKPDLSMLSSPPGPSHRSNDVPHEPYRKMTNQGQYQNYMQQPPIQQQNPQPQPQQQQQQQPVTRKMSHDQYGQQSQPPRQGSRQGTRDQYPVRQASQDQYGQQYQRPVPQQQNSGYQQQQQQYNSYRGYVSSPPTGPPNSAPPAPPMNTTPQQPISRPRNRI